MQRIVWLSAVLAAAICLGRLASARGPGQGPFRDVPLQHWAYDAVNELAALGIIIGYPDGTFRGGSAITRYELAWLFHSVTIANPGLGAEPPPNVPDAPSPGSRPHVPAGWNVAAGHWALDAVAALADRHVLAGYPNGRLDVERPVTRYETVLALHRILKDGLILVLHGRSNTGPALTGVPKTHWAAESVAWLRELGLLEGYPDGGFGGERPVTRGELSVILERFRQRRNEIIREYYRASRTRDKPGAAPGPASSHRIRAADRGLRCPPRHRVSVALDGGMERSALPSRVLPSVRHVPHGELPSGATLSWRHS